MHWIFRLCLSICVWKDRKISLEYVKQNFVIVFESVGTPSLFIKNVSSLVINAKRETILVFFSCSEVNSNGKLLFTSKLINQHMWKVLFTCVPYIITLFIIKVRATPEFPGFSGVLPRFQSFVRAFLSKLCISEHIYKTVLSLDSTVCFSYDNGTFKILIW